MEASQFDSQLLWEMMIDIIYIKMIALEVKIFVVLMGLPVDLKLSVYQLLFHIATDDNSNKTKHLMFDIYCLCTLVNLLA